MDEQVKKGLSEQAPIKDAKVYTNDNPGQMTNAPKPEKASKGGKTFKIT